MITRNKYTEDILGSSELRNNASNLMMFIRVPLSKQRFIESPRQTIHPILVKFNEPLFKGQWLLYEDIGT